MERSAKQATETRIRSREGLRRFFWYLNRLVMVPIFRLGLGALIGSPPTGYIMVLKTIGAKTGKTRYTPLNYAILRGNVYCIAGWGQVSHWYRNLHANPHVEILMPGGTLAGLAEEVTDPGEWLYAIRRVMQNNGFVSYIAGINPFRVTDEQLREKARGAALVRIRPSGIGGGPGDPGGWLWIVSWALHAAGAVWLLRRLRSHRRTS